MGMDWDPDIAALKLSDVEKDGLQVHRNYSRAFEKHTATESTQLDDSIEADMLTR